jgi:hypothetical protein
MQEAVTVACGLNWLTLVGHAYDTGGMPPYLPFIEALQEYASASQPAELAARLAEAGPEVALLVPALRRTHSEPPSTQSDPETQRYRLFESVCDFLLKTAGSGSPYAGLLLCLDDLHWVDELPAPPKHLTRADLAPIVILATYRDTELTVAPLARTGATYSSGGSRIDLKRLDRKALRASPPWGPILPAFVDGLQRDGRQPSSARCSSTEALGGWTIGSLIEVSETDVPQRAPGN